MKNRLKIALCTATVLTGYLIAPSYASSVSLRDNVGAWSARAQKTGTVAADTKIELVVHMKLRNEEQLKSFVAAVSKPWSPVYGRYLTKEDFKSAYAPDAADVAAVRDFLTASGMMVTRTAASGIYIAATGTVGQVREALKVNQDYFKYGNRIVRANSVAPSLPEEIAGKVRAIEGLDEAADIRHPGIRSAVAGPRVAAKITSTSAATPTPPPVAAGNPSSFCATYYNGLSAKMLPAVPPFGGTLPWLMCGYTPQQVQAAYSADKTAYTGEGVVVAIVDAFASPTIFADANAYAANHNLPALTNANFEQTIPHGIYEVSPNAPCGPQGWWGEESLDVSAVHGMAPGAKINFVGGKDCGTGLAVALADTIDNAAANIITNSYSYNGEGLSPAQAAADDALFMEAASFGITLLFSSGDDGDLSQDNGVASGAWAADSAYVTAVGGTSLGVLNAKGKKLEWGWGTYRNILEGVTIAPDGSSITNTGGSAYSFYAGAGGGASLVELQPDYQAGIVPSVLSGQTYAITGEPIYFGTPHRVSPDVALVADPYTGYLYGESFTIAGNPISDYGCVPTTGTQEYCEGSIGGTSLSSPLMAGVIARVDQARIAKAKPYVGFANPWLYGLAVGKLGSTTSPLVDIVAPTHPTAVLRGYQSNPGAVRVVGINASLAPACSKASGICEGVDDVFNYTAPGFDNVTGLGAPDVAVLVKQ